MVMLQTNGGTWKEGNQGNPKICEKSREGQLGYMGFQSRVSLKGIHSQGGGGQGNQNPWDFVPFGNESLG